MVQVHIQWPLYFSLSCRWRTAVLVLFVLCSVERTASFRPHTLRRGSSSYSSSSSLLHKVVTSDNALSTDGSPDKDNKKKFLSRPERKARERTRKQQRRKHNFAARADILRARTSPGEGRYDLHSNAVSRLTTSSSPDDVLRAIKRAQNLHDAHDIRAIERFLLEQTDETYAYGFRGSLLSRLAVAALHMNNHPLARKAMDEREKHHIESALPMESAALVRGLLRVHNVTDALSVLNSELPLPTVESVDTTTAEQRDLIEYRASAVCSVASRHFYEGEPSQAILACQQLTEVGPAARAAGMLASDLRLPWDRLLTGAAYCEAGRRDGDVHPCEDVAATMPCNVVYAVLDALTAFPPANTDRVYEKLSNALVRRVVFVTGAVSLESCPPADRGEAVFVGRSNVGKSSLVNMVTNRKSLAYTSKRPGKTQQFNFFSVNDKVGREKEIRYGDKVDGEKDADSFYIVDVPGFGFARVPEAQRREWSFMLRTYMMERRTLRVMFHLIDGRLGPTDEDVGIMEEAGKHLPRFVKYVVVLTKADKNVKGASSRRNAGKVPQDVMRSLQRKMQDCGVGKAPIVVSSAETKLGRNDLWRYLRLAAEA